MERITARGLTFDVRVDGPADGEPVLLLHGLPQTSETWLPTTELLNAAGLRTIAPDQRGYSPGARPARVEAYRITETTADAVALLDALGYESAHLVGHDWGAAVVWNIAGRHPERARSLTAVSVPHPAAAAQAIAIDPDQQQLSSYIGLFRQDGTAEEALLADDASLFRSMLAGSGLTEPHVDRYAERVLNDKDLLTGGLNWYRAMTLLDVDGIGPITCPTTHVWGEDDTFFGVFSANRCGEHVTGPFEQVRLQGVSHWIPELEPAALARLVLARVGSLSADTAT
jgi:pimeloyl-ACP methyl ester carboxylesterase